MNKITQTVIVIRQFLLNVVELWRMYKIFGLILLKVAKWHRFQIL